ncbi:MAG: GAF domain-containing protein [Bacteroidota bacterium]|nr:GAF domain-containing protein [Bacteroidota bacterium]
MKLTLGRRFFIAFLTLISLFVINAIISLTVIFNNQNIAEKISTVTEPSLKALDDFNLMIIQSKMLTTNWVYLRTKEDDKNALIKLHSKDYPAFKSQLTKLSKNWLINGEKAILDSVFIDFEKLLKSENAIMQSLSTFESYDDPMIKLESESMVDEVVLPQTTSIIAKLERLKQLKIKGKQSDENQLNASNNMLVYIIVLLGIILVLISIVVAYYLTRSITEPVKQIKEAVAMLGKGKLVAMNLKKRNDEIGDMQQSVEDLINGLKYTSQFAQNVGNSKFDTEYNALSEDDELGHSLITMRDNLKKAAEEDRRRNWASSGMAQLGDKLRDQYKSTEEMYDAILQFIVKYVNTNQGKLYEIQSDSNGEYLELVACYAFSRKKFLHERIEIGEGLIGQSVIEVDKIYLTDVPEDYIKITSGLGEANPNCILIMPLKVVDKVHGVLELASFKVLEPYEVEFVEKAAESIASSISIVKVNERTRKLLEESQIQSEQLRSQEEEMRQNMEELHATQEEMERKNKDMESLLEESKQREKELKLEIQHLKNTTNA